MLRIFVCALAAFALLVGTSEAAKDGKKAKGKAVAGKILKVESKDGKTTLTVQVTHRKKGQEPTTEEKTFTVTDDTPAAEAKEGAKPEQTTVGAIKAKLVQGAHVRLMLDPADNTKVTKLAIGGGRRGKKKQNQ